MIALWKVRIAKSRPRFQPQNRLFAVLVGNTQIRVAEHFTALPERAVLEAKLHDAAIRALRRIEAIVDENSGTTK